MSREVVNKEREAEKGKSPLGIPLKEKGEEKEISTFPSPLSPSRSHVEPHGKGKGEVDISNPPNREGKGKAVRIDVDFEKAEAAEESPAWLSDGGKGVEDIIAAEHRYWCHLKKISLFFKAQ